MKPLDNYYVKFNKWTGKILKLSTIPFLKNDLENDLENDYINLIGNQRLIDVYQDRKSLESVFVVYLSDTHKYDVYDKTGIIYLFPCEKIFTEIKTEKNDIPSDVNVTVYIQNKLLDIEITMWGIKSWYNPRREKEFFFESDPEFIFQITDKNDKLIKNIILKSNVFLKNFKTTIDLIDLKDIANIKIKTLRLFPNYFLNFKNSKYISEGETKSNNTLTKVDLKNNIKNYDLVISKTNDDKKILIKNNISDDIIYKKIYLYITGKDLNELYEIITIPAEDLKIQKNIIVTLKYDLKNKIIWKSNKKITVLFNEDKVNIL